MNIRKAEKRDIAGIHKLLYQVNLIHHNGRPDIFKYGTNKYSDSELEALLEDKDRPVLVAVEGETVVGYAFCILQQNKNDNILTDIKTLYIDDLCVDETQRGQHIGKQLYAEVQNLAKEEGCYHVTLNVWCLNPGAMKFYEACGMKPLKIVMEEILK